MAISYNTMDISNDTIDIIVEEIIKQTIEISDINILENKRKNLISQAEKIVKLLTNEKNQYQQILNLLQHREILSKKIEELNKILKGNQEISSVQREDINNTIKNYQEQKLQMSNIFKNKYQNQEATYEIFTQILKFQAALNDLLGQQQELYYVFSYYHKPLVYKLDLSNDESIKKFITARYNKDTFTGAFQITKKFFDEQKLSALSGSEYDISQALSTTYDTVMTRYRKSKLEKNNPTSNWIFWQTGKRRPKWEGIKVGQEGDINEAYALFFFQKKKFIKQVNIEKNVEFYALEGIQTVDDISGLLQGDISLEGGRELAIKSPGASMLSFNQIIDIAQKISKEWKNKNVKDLIKQLLEEKMKKQQASTGSRHQIFSSLETTIKKEMKPYIEKLAKDY